MRTLNAPAWLIEGPIAHRGLHDVAQGVIENTLDAAKAAIQAGFAIECDVQLSADGQAFVFHDDTLDRLTDRTGALIERSATEIAGARISSAGASPPTFAEFLGLVAGRTPVVCELKSRFDRDWRIADRIAALATSYDGPLAFKSFDPNLVAYLRLCWPLLGPKGRPCPVGIVAEASYDDPAWDFLTEEQKRECVDWEELMRRQPDFLSFKVDDLPHKTPFFMKQLYGLPVMTWTVRTADQREAARKWADQIIFEGKGRP
ncbi:MAG TPA: glycerophosphodiester phosphodiesterase family protein [Roseiarcus sp.]|nr:glycerophosphodiester phosphodiesterase family protein [Roseiarcus sp.]